MALINPERSKRQVTDAHRSHRGRQIAGLVVGSVVATSALALPALANTIDGTVTAAGLTVATTAATAMSSRDSHDAPATSATSASIAPASMTAPADTAATPPVAAPDPAAGFAAQISSLSPSELVAFKLFIASPEERAAFAVFVAPPAPPTPAPTPTPAPAPKPVAASTAPGGYLACVRNRESHGNYSVNTGNGYYGAYQFSQSTWNSAANHAGRRDLVGVHPSNVSPGDQDAMAESLYAWQGRAPWAGPGC